MRLVDDKFYIVSYEWFDVLEEAPIISSRIIPDCSWGGKASILTLDPNTGETIWGYTYEGVDSYHIYFENQNIYLTGSGNHGASRSIAQINGHSGILLSLECYKWPNKRDIPHPPDNEGKISSPFIEIREKEDFERILEREWVGFLFWAEGTKLNIWDGETKDIVGSVTFQGYELNPWAIDVAVLGDVAVVNFDDSNQLFSFRLNSWVID